MSRILLCLLAQGAFALKVTKNQRQLDVKTFVDDIVQEQQENLERLKKYTFAEFREQFQRTYTGSEIIRREKIFKKNLQSLIQHNSSPSSSKTYLMSINKFMDYTEDEFKKLLGYRRTKSFGSTSFLQGAQAPQWNDTLNVVKVPSSHDWRPQLSRFAHSFQDQGACGSCWATAAVTCLQNHIQIKHGISDFLSTQALVSCTPNPRHCGGTGGCQGATAELAFEYIAKHGIPSDSKWPYASFTGSNGHCTPAKAKLTHAKIDHHVVLPENKGEPLLQVLYQEGPVVVSVDASNWNFYGGGVFAGCDKDAIINHAVVAEGFGEQPKASGPPVKYYLIKNSWGQDWGEQGYIRLMRFDDDEAHCGTDNKPEEGTACEGGPAFVRVCGMCGVLYDSTYPRGATFVSKAQGGTFDEQAIRAGIPMEHARRNFADKVMKPLNQFIQR